MLNPIDKNQPPQTTNPLGSQDTEKNLKVLAEKILKIYEDNARTCDASYDRSTHTEGHNEYNWVNNTKLPNLEKTRDAITPLLNELADLQKQQRVRRHGPRRSRHRRSTR